MEDKDKIFKEPPKVKDALVEDKDTVLNIVEDGDRRLSIEKSDEDGDTALSIQDASIAEDAIDVRDDRLIGQTLGGNIVIKDFIGKGGMSTVYEGWHSQIDRAVAVKVMNPQLLTEKNALLRFNQEAQAVGKLDHPGIVRVHDYRAGEKGYSYLVMDYVRGEPLDEVIEKKGALDAKEAISLLKQTCDAIQHAHRQNVVHRDLKPSNIIVTRDDANEEMVKILDFGIAKVLPQKGDKREKLTQTGEVFGSPLYMSPEQCMGTTIDHRADIYAMGCMIYECFTGEVPFRGANVLDTFFKHTTEMPDSVGEKNQNLSSVDEIDAIVLKAMAKDPEDRYQSMDELKKDLEELEERIDNPEMKSTLTQKEIARRKEKASKKVEKPNYKAIIVASVITILIVVAVSGYLVSQRVESPSKSFDELYLEGQRNFDKGEYNRARSLFQKALEKAGRDRTRTLPVLRELDDLERVNGNLTNDYGLKIDERKKAAEAQIASEVEDLVARLGGASGKEVLRIAGDINDKVLQLPYNDSSNSKIAIDSLTSAIKSLEKNNLTKTIVYARSNHNRAYWYFFKRDYVQAREGYRKSIDILSEKIKTDISALDHLLKGLEWLARVEIAIGNQDKVKDVLDRRMDFAGKASTLEQREIRKAETHKLLAEYYLLSNKKLDDALKDIQHAIRTYEGQSLGGESLAECYVIEGKIFQKKGDLDKARDDFKKAVGLFEGLSVRKSHFWIDSLSSLADILAAEGKSSEAEGYYRRALAVSLRHMPDLTDTTDHIFEQLTMLLEKNSNNLSLRDEEKVVKQLVPLAKLRLTLDQNKHGQKSKVVVDDYVKLASFAVRARDYEEARNYLDSAGKIAARLGDDNWSQVKILTEQAMLNYDTGNTEEGKKLFSQALAKVENLKSEIPKNPAIFNKLHFQVKFRVGENSEMYKSLNALVGN